MTQQPKSTPKGTLKGVPLFKNLADPVRESYEHDCTWRRFAPDEQIIDRTSDSREVFFIVEGRVRVVNYSLSGREISFDELEGGEFFGELAAIDGGPRSANVVALADTLVALMSPERFTGLVTEHPSPALTIMRRLAAIIRASTGRIMDLSTLAAHDRVRAEILRLARPCLRADGTAHISPIPIHADIASRVSTTRETVSRVFGDLTRHGLLKRAPHALILLDVARLDASLEETADLE
jgi:CRP/FNR family cyclic AMP-dependent transcriptional regulator